MSLRVDDAHAGCAVPVFIVDDFTHDRERPEREITRGVGGGKRRSIAAEIGAVRAAADAAVAVLAGRAAVVGLGEIGDATDDDRATAKGRGHAALHVFFKAVHLHRWQELSIGQMRQAFETAADAGEFLRVIIPRRDVRVADRPIHRDAFLGVGFKI